MIVKFFCYSHFIIYAEGFYNICIECRLMSELIQRPVFNRLQNYRLVHRKCPDRLSTHPYDTIF